MNNFKALLQYTIDGKQTVSNPVKAVVSRILKKDDTMKLEYFTATNGKKIAIPREKITGFTEVDVPHGNSFIATGADDIEGGENGWYVAEKFETVKAILQSC